MKFSKGQKIEAKFSDGSWYPAKIVSANDTTKKAKVAYTDGSGDTGTVPFANIRIKKAKPSAAPKTKPKAKAPKTKPKGPNKKPKGPNKKPAKPSAPAPSPKSVNGFTEFTQARAREVSLEALAALEAVADKYGITVSKGRGTFSDSDFKFVAVFKAQADAKHLAGSVDMRSQEAKNFLNLAPFYDMNAAWLGKKIPGDEHGRTITGMSSRRGRTPVRAVSKNGDRWRISPSLVIAAFRNK